MVFTLNIYFFNTSNLGIEKAMSRNYFYKYCIATKVKIYDHFKSFG